MSEENKNTTGNAIELAKLVFTTITIVWAVKFISGLFGKDDDRKKNEEKAQSAADQIYSQTPPSYTDNQYMDWANILDNAILGGFTEDMNAVYSTFGKLKNISDLVKVNEFFATRRMQRTMQNVTLGEAMHHYFNSFEIKTVNAILKKNKIAYSF